MTVRTQEHAQLLKPISASNRRRLNELDRMRNALAEIMPADYIRVWMDNDRLGGHTPIEIVEHGEADRLSALIDRIPSGEPS